VQKTAWFDEECLVNYTNQSFYSWINESIPELSVYILWRRRCGRNRSHGHPC